MTTTPGPTCEGRSVPTLRGIRPGLCPDLTSGPIDDRPGRPGPRHSGATRIANGHTSRGQPAEFVMRRYLVAAGSFTLLLASATLVATAQEVAHVVVADGLENPRQLNWSGDTLLIAEGGQGGDNCARLPPPLPPRHLRRRRLPPRAPPSRPRPPRPRPPRRNRLSLPRARPATTTTTRSVTGTPPASPRSMIRTGPRTPRPSGSWTSSTASRARRAASVPTGSPRRASRACC